MTSERPGASAAAADIVAIRPGLQGARRVWLRPHEPFRWAPGQLLELWPRPDAEPSMLAIASAPDERPSLLLLIRPSTDTEAIASLVDGQIVSLRGPLGAGFPLDDLTGRDLLLVAAGTAIAPLRAVIEAALDDRGRFGRITLVHGVRRPDGFFFADHHARWAEAGVALHLVASGAAADWSGRRGWVQAHVGELVTPNTVALIAGMPEMEAATRAALVEAGLAPEDVRVNHAGL